MKLKTDYGFTLVEILIVVIIIGILVVIGIPRLEQIRKTTWTKTCLSNRSTLFDLTEVYATEKRIYPSTQDDLRLAGYIKNNFSCPAPHTSDTYSIQSDHTWSCSNTLHD